MRRVPRIFHFVFGLRPQTEPFHLCFYLCLASCMEVNRPDRVVLHYRYMPYGPWWDRIKDRLALRPIELDTYFENYAYPDPSMEPYRYAHLADAARLRALLDEGGIYADIDTLFVRPLPEAFYTRRCTMGKEKVDWNAIAAREAGGSLCNAWIMAEPGSLFIKRWLDELYRAFDGTWSAHATFLPYRLSKQMPEAIHVEPERSFFPYDWSKQGIRRLFERELTDCTGVYSIHLWSHLWWDKQRTAFTYFHHGRLTPNYVAHARTAYSQLARRFLPSDVETSPEGYRSERRQQMLEDVAMRWEKAWRLARRMLQGRA